MLFFFLLIFFPPNEKKVVRKHLGSNRVIYKLTDLLWSPKVFSVLACRVQCTICIHCFFSLLLKKNVDLVRKHLGSNRVMYKLVVQLWPHMVLWTR
jgi:hypothetical protein